MAELEAVESLGTCISGCGLSKSIINGSIVTFDASYQSILVGLPIKSSCHWFP